MYLQEIYQKYISTENIFYGTIHKETKMYVFFFVIWNLQNLNGEANLLADGARLDGGHVFCLVHPVFVHYQPPSLHS